MEPSAKTSYFIAKLVFSIIIVLCITSISAQNTQVIEIWDRGEKTSSANVNVTLPNQRAKDIPIHIGYSFPSGTTILTSGTTKLELESGKNRQEIGRNTKHILEHLTLKEHSHNTLEGECLHYHNNKSVRYKASGNFRYATSNNTEFSVKVDGQTAIFRTLKGQITTVEEIKLLVDQESRTRASKRERPLTMGKTTFVNAGESKQFDGNKKVQKVDSYQQAFGLIQQQIDNNRDEGYFDDEQLANEYLLMGELSLDEGNDIDAINYFSTAIKFFKNLEFMELSIAEGYLLKAEAYYMAGNTDKVNEFANNAIGLIEPILHIDTLDYNYAIEDEDYELMDEIAYDLFDEYDYLGWAYELLKEYDRANYYYRKADELGVGYD